MYTPPLQDLLDTATLQPHLLLITPAPVHRVERR